jgi:hypothetical protein
LKTYAHLWQCHSAFFSEWEIFQTTVVERFKTHILCSITFFSPENLAVYEMIWKSDNVTRRMRFVCWINRATHTHTQNIYIYIILIAFPRQQWLRERASLLRYTYIACLVSSIDPLSYQTFPWHCVTESVAQCHGVCQAWRLPTFATSTVFSLTFSSQ